MPTYQTSLQNSRTLVIGSVKAEVSATSSFSTTLTNIGIGRGFTITENITQSNIQADNAEEPLEFLTDHTATISFEMLELYLPTLYQVRNTIDTLSTSTASGAFFSLFVGGKSKMSPRYWKFTNTIYSNDGTTTYDRIIHVLSATIGQGLTMAFQSDKAEDPALSIPISLTAKLDTSRTSTQGQLYYIEDFYALSTK